MSKDSPKPAGLLVLPRLRAQNVNAISSPLTWGFPAPTAFLGFVHALELRLSSQFRQGFEAVGIVCHRFKGQTFQPNRSQHLIFSQNRNAVFLKEDALKFESSGTPPAIVEEGHAQLEASIVVSVMRGFDEDAEGDEFARVAGEIALGMRLAGGSLIPQIGNRATQPHWVSWPDVTADQRVAFARLRRKLLPGFALVHRPDLLAERIAKLKDEGENLRPSTALDALLDLCGLNYRPAAPPDEPDWTIERRSGWLVPLPIGYAGLSPLYPAGEVKGSRDAETPFRFVESLISLGQWISPHRLTQLDQILWRSKSDPDAGLYRCENRFAELLDQPEPDPTQENNHV